MAKLNNNIKFKLQRLKDGPYKDISDSKSEQIVKELFRLKKDISRYRVIILILLVLCLINL